MEVFFGLLVFLITIMLVLCLPNQCRILRILLLCPLMMLFFGPIILMTMIVIRAIITIFEDIFINFS